jgi:hypothetical protein
LFVKLINDFSLTVNLSDLINDGSHNKVKQI